VLLKSFVISLRVSFIFVIQQLLEQFFGGMVPNLRDVINSRIAFESLSKSSTIREAAVIMDRERKGVLVMDGSKLVGILTPKDLLNRVVAESLSTECQVCDVMTAYPDCVNANMNVIEALREMHSNKYLHLPVCDENSGAVLGVVDVMELLHESSGAGGEDGAGRKGWRDFFKGAMDARDDDALSEASSSSPMSSLIGGSISSRHQAISRLDEVDSFSDEALSFTNRQQVPVVYKVTDSCGLTHRIKTEKSIVEFYALRAAVAAKFNISPELLLLKYVDDEKDEVVISNDESLSDAIDLCRVGSPKVLKLIVSIMQPTKEVGLSYSFSGFDGLSKMSGGLLIATAIIGFSFSLVYLRARKHH